MRSVVFTEETCGEKGAVSSISSLSEREDRLTVLLSTDNQMRRTQQSHEIYVSGSKNLTSTCHVRDSQAEMEMGIQIRVIDGV